MSDTYKKIHDNFDWFKDENIDIDKTAHNQTKKYTRLNFESITLAQNGFYINNISKENIYKYKVNDDAKTLIFENCFFDSIKISNFKTTNTSYILFKNCKIRDLEIINIDDKSKKITFQGGTINSLSICDTTINRKLYINQTDEENDLRTEIKMLKISNTTFQENFKLQNCDITETSIQNTDFEKNVDFYGSVFEKGLNQDNIIFNNLNINGMALFGKTIFKNKFILKYVTLKESTHFKNSTFEKGLDLDLCNINKEINFHQMKILNHTTTSQETFRIIKYQFEKVGNKIEANRYHTYELEKRRENIKDDGSLEDRLIYWAHDTFSKHSSSWFRALLWIFITGLVTALLHSSFLYLLFIIPLFSISSIIKCKFNYILSFQLIILLLAISTSSINFNDIFKFISLLAKADDFCHNYFLMTLNKVSLGYLYYQFILAVRKDTRK